MIRLLFILVFVLSIFLTTFSCQILCNNIFNPFESLVSLYLLTLAAIVNLLAIAGIFGEWE